MTVANVVGFDEALQIVLGYAAEFAIEARKPACETKDLLECFGRVLAEEVKADRDQPPFDRSTRDGFAVRAVDSTGTALRVVGLVRAGERWNGGALEQGAAVEIMTGAPMPEGADAVVMVEHVERDGDAIRLMDGRAIRRGENVVPRGSEARASEAVLAAGTVVGGAEIALAAACGYAELPAFCRPRVAIVSTGDELVELDEVPGAQQIRNSNSYALKSLVDAASGVGERMAIARDVREELRDRVSLGRRADLLLFSGGVSMGKYDLVEEVLAEFGAEFFFTGVKMQPGKPVVFGRLPKFEDSDGVGRECLFFGLPGNPISAQVTFHCFVEPLLRAMGGAGVQGPRFVQATLAEEVEGKAGLMRVLPARLTPDRVRPEVRLVGWHGSGDLTANARANCYAVLPPEKERFGVGEIVTVLLR
ncbi:gephyrin-like molybdotransferase Glp [Granulicella sp. L60]|uniref:molybdopterin molybdotransferase MoeA n=1 Tax=Granulicella sp. L60 TaxID=1641866 RepID=UPI0020B13CB8|nr:gephyrin-like molybdotransferase Glp [Granulicella sp. L60]